MADGTTNLPASPPAKEPKAPKPAADRLPGRPLQLLEPEPWPDPVDGASLLDEISAFFSSHLTLEPGAADALALWCMFTHVLNAAEISPRLCLTSPEKRCGKTTALGIVTRLAMRPLPTANITLAALFRAVEQAQPTLLIDEADTFLARSDDMRGILNSGHNRAAAFVIRSVGDAHEPRQFSTWSAVAIALIGRLPDTLRDRSIEIRMRRRRPTEAHERVGPYERLALDRMARQIARWAADHIDTLREANPTLPGGLHDRAGDNWRPLLAIADRAGSHWSRRAHEAARLLSAEVEDASLGVRLLADIRAVFERPATADRLTSTALVAQLVALEDRPWVILGDQGPLTPPRLARLLRPYGISPVTIRLNAVETAKGYYRSAFADAFARYLPA